MARLKKLLRIAFATHVLAGIGVIAIILLAPRWTIGEGRFNELVRDVETFDWRWVLLVPAIGIWLAPIAIVLLWNKAREAGSKADQVRDIVAKLLEGRQMPVVVDVNARIPVVIEEPLRVPIELDTAVPVDQAVDIETTLPIRIELPIDTEVETKVFGLGALKIPIRARVPIDILLPVKGSIRVRSAGLPVQLRTEATVRLPPFEVPVVARIETRLDLLENLRLAESSLRKRLASKPD